MLAVVDDDYKFTAVDVSSYGREGDAVEETARNSMELDQDCMEGVVKSLRCSAAKHAVRNEQYVVGHCDGAIGSHISKQWAFPFNVLYHCSQDIHVVRVVYGSTGFDSV
ncbi:hypothetical protein TNCV_3401341 [Trichonephila clavipes]|nr:hypothetical protein TNCV_3401341 [Trichonephila clavipes]